MKQERVYFTKGEGGYAAYAVNMPLVVQAKTLEGVKSKLGRLFKSYLEQLNKLAESEEPFEYVEEHLPQMPDNPIQHLPF